MIRIIIKRYFEEGDIVQVLEMEGNVNHDDDNDENKNDKQDKYFVVPKVTNINIVECIDSKQKFSIHKFEQSQIGLCLRLRNHDKNESFKLLIQYGLNSKQLALILKSFVKRKMVNNI